jgi:hypothetical protein
MALGLIHEIGHLLIARYEAERQPGVMTAALASLRRIWDGTPSACSIASASSAGRGPEPEPPEHRLEELLLTRVANENPAIGPLKELIDDRPLAEGTRYRDAIQRLEATFAGGPPVDGDGLSLFELMRLPARQAPTSLAGQLRFIQATWGIFLGEGLEALIRRLDLAIGILAEEERALHLRFGGGGDGGGGAGRRAEGPTFGSARRRARRSRPIRPWMPEGRPDRQEHLCLAGSAVANHARDIRTLDAILGRGARRASPAGAAPGCG